MTRIYYQTKHKVIKLTVNLKKIDKVTKHNIQKDINKMLVKPATQFTMKL